MKRQHSQRRTEAMRGVGSDLQVEAQQVTDDPRHGRQDDHLSDVVQQRVHGQTVQSKRSVQLLRDTNTVSGALQCRYDRVRACFILLTFSNLVASLRTLLTRVSSSFLFGFFSIFKYKLI